MAVDVDGPDAALTTDTVGSKRGYSDSTANEVLPNDAYDRDAIPLHYPRDGIHG